VGDAGAGRSSGGASTKSCGEGRKYLGIGGEEEGRWPWRARRRDARATASWRSEALARSDQTAQSVWRLGGPCAREWSRREARQARATGRGEAAARAPVARAARGGAGASRGKRRRRSRTLPGEARPRGVGRRPAVALPGRAAGDAGGCWEERRET
jgi:hypothetical protein